MLKQSVAIIPLEDMAERLNKVSWHSNYFSACCPFHDDSHASLICYDDGYFKCLACGVYGNHQKLERKLRGEIRPQKAEHQATPPWLSWEKKYGSYENAAIQAYNNGKNFPALLSYIKQRKLDNFIKQGKFGWLDNWFSFPVFDADGDMIDWIVRAHPKKQTEIRYAIRPRKNRNDNHLYCPDWNFLAKSQEIYFPFGLLDAWSIFACELPAMTGITGQLINPELLSDIRKRIYIIPDKGEGQGARRLQQQLDWRGIVLCLNYPDDCKDSNDILRLHGVNILKELIEEAKHETIY